MFVRILSIRLKRNILNAVNQPFEKESVRKNKKLLLVTLLFVLFASNAALADILGDTVVIKYLWPNTSTPDLTSATGVVTAGGVSLNTFGDILVTVYADRVDLVGTHNPRIDFISAAFNGFSIQDTTNPSAFTGFSVDGASDVAGFDSTFVSLSGGLLYINMQGLTVPYQKLARVDFTSSNSVPEPSTLVLLGSGLLGVAEKLRRRLLG